MNNVLMPRRAHRPTSWRADFEFWIASLEFFS